ncbi:MAG: type II secretion system F family protein [Selenomonas sp.]|uniref:type II secretion system F family protein n=1 Tax=Selenomonas sp. TaxID=2053611 RepID=UPI0025FBC97B|nr:type II secretion system F family protein [Selenomonas sp.]MCR5757438.1 type II secretion system F family protein [Selenomonas sp.]
MHYQYEACNRQREQFQGTVEAGSRQEAAHKIRRQGLWITAITCPKQTTIPELKNISLHHLFSVAVSPAQIALFFRQLAVLLGAGIPVHDALKALQTSRKQGSYARLLNQLYQQVLQGKSLSMAMAESHNFSPQISQLVAAGESAGTLEETFSRLADFLARQVKDWEQLKSILLYPVIIGVTAIAVLIFMTLFILPAFAAMLQNLQAELPLPTKLLLFLADFFQTYGMETAWLCVFFLAGLSALSRRPLIRRFGHRCLLSLPLLGKLAGHTAWSIALRTLAMQLEQGIPLHEALKNTASAAGNHYLAEELRKVQVKVEQGCSLLMALQDCPFFPPMLQEMLAAGEQAGQLEIMLNKAADFCSVLAENESARLQALAEPAAIFLVGGLVFFMVMAIIMPLLNTMDALQL